jgi:long-chain fatty acid transport protein
MYRLRCWCLAFILLIASACHCELFAGGWDRFDQGVDLLFDPSQVVIDVGLFDLIPSRKFQTVNGAPEIVNTVPNIFRPSINAKFSLFEDAACLATYRQPFGLNNDYGSTWSQASIIVSRTLTVEELGLTCSYRVKAGPGYIRLIGGVTESFATYHEEAFRKLPNGSFIRPALDLEASATGWRAGLAYEIPNKAFRASLMYYSNIDLSARGSLRQLPLGGNVFLDTVSVSAATPLPRALEAALHTAIAPAWLNTVSVKWVDWSTLTSVPVILNADAGPLRTGRVLTSLNAFFRDGWTISDTVTHLWSPSLALSVRVGWDRGVATGWTDNPEAWSTLFFANYRISEHVEVIGGIGLIHLTAAEINKAAQPGGFIASAGPGNVLFTNLGFRTRF